jgi:hypothetical protein
MADVTSATARSLLLRPSESLDVPEPAPHAIIEYVSEARAYRLCGQLESGDRDGVLRFLVTSRPIFLQRREHVRAQIDVVMVLASEDSNVRLVGRSRNLSVGGALGDFPEPPTAGERLRFSLVPRVGRDGVKGVCRVLRVDDPFGVAVRFEDVTAEQAGRLAEFILRHRGGGAAQRRRASR